jgi:hypothetical protein
MNTNYAFGVRVAFLLEQRNKPYETYGEMSSTEEKDAIAQKAFQLMEHCCVAGWAGASL